MIFVNRSFNMIIAITALVLMLSAMVCMCEEIEVASSSEVIGQGLPQMVPETPAEKQINGVPVDYLISEIDRALDDQKLAVVVDTEIGTPQDTESTTETDETETEEPRVLKRGKRPTRKPDDEMQPVTSGDDATSEKDTATEKSDKTEIQIIKIDEALDEASTAEKTNVNEENTDEAAAEEPAVEKETPVDRAPAEEPAADKTPAEKAAPASQESTSSEITPAEETIDTQPVPSKKYLVRSSPILTETDAQERMKALEAEGYHPIAREELIGDNDKFFVLDMGRFNKIELAINMLEKVREIDPDFFIVGTRFVRSEYKGLFSNMEMDTMFPHISGDGGEDSLALLTGQVAGPKTGAAVVKMEGDSQEKLIVRKNINGDEEGIDPSDNNFRLIAGSAEQNLELDETETGQKENIPKEHDSVKQRMLVHEKLQEMAWDMRAQGLSVYLENESFDGPEGTLAGMFDDKDSALELGEELRGYGYSVNVIRETGINDMYYVYADPDSTSREMMVITPEDFQQYEKKNNFNPPPNPALDTLLGLVRTTR